MINKTKIKYFSWLERILIIVVVITITAAVVWAADRKINNSIGQNNADNSGCPADMVYIVAPGGGFCLDKFEASPGNDCPYINPSSQSETLLNIDSRDCRTVAENNKIPWCNISQNQAAMACAKAGKRLPTNKEWQQAALGTPDVNSDWKANDCQVARNWPIQPGPTGSAKKCLSSAGAFDMIGNVWEWTGETVYDGKYENRQLPASGYVAGIDEKGLPTGTNENLPDDNYYQDYFWLKTSDARAVARGGYWNNGSDAGQYSIYAVLPPGSIQSSIGFRCAK